MGRLERGFWGGVSANGILDEPRLLVLSFYITRPDTATAGWELHAWHRGCPFVLSRITTVASVCVYTARGWTGGLAGTIGKGGGNTGEAGRRSIGDGLQDVGRSGPVCGFPFFHCDGWLGQDLGMEHARRMKCFVEAWPVVWCARPTGFTGSGLCLGCVLGHPEGVGHQRLDDDGWRWVPLSAQVSSSSTTMESAAWNN